MMNTQTDADNQVDFEALYLAWKAKAEHYQNKHMRLLSSCRRFLRFLNKFSMDHEPKQFAEFVSAMNAAKKP